MLNPPEGGYSDGDNDRYAATPSVFCSHNKRQGGNCPRLHPYRFRIQQTIEPWRNHKDFNRQWRRAASLWFRQNHMVLDPCEAATEGRGQSNITSDGDIKLLSGGIRGDLSVAEGLSTKKPIKPTQMVRRCLRGLLWRFWRRFSLGAIIRQQS